MLKKYTSIVWIVFGVIAVSAGSGLLQDTKQKQPPKATPIVTPQKQPATTPKTTAVQDASAKDRTVTPLQPSPSISLSLNLLHDAKAPEGRSLLIEAALSAYDGREGSREFTLAKPEGSWSDLVSIEVRDSSNKVVPGLTIRPLIKTESSILLNDEQMGWMAWVADFTVGARLAAGTYTFVAVLDSNSIGLDQKIASPPSTLEVLAASAAVSEDDARILALSEARILGYQSKDAEAIAACERYLLNNPNDSLLLEEKGDLFMKLNKPTEALASYNEALKYVEPPDDNAVPEPPFGLIRKKQMAENALLGEDSGLKR